MTSAGASSPSAEIVSQLRALSDPGHAQGMARFGISSQKALGISMPKLRWLARRVGRDHTLAQELWATGIHEARILATLVDAPEWVTESQMERWALDFDSWDLCDQCCGNLFDRTPFAYLKAVAWSRRDEQFVKRAAFSLMAYLAVHDRQASDKRFLKFLPAIRRASRDERNFVKKAVNWALRQIGKRSLALNARAIETACALQALDSPSARWIAADALRELQSAAVQKKLSRSGSLAKPVRTLTSGL